MAVLRIGIIGAGIIGCGTAFELARRGAAVTVFDGRSPGQGATHASAGILAPRVEGHHDPTLMDLCLRGLAAYDEFVAHVRGTPDAPPFEYRRSGTLEIADTGHREQLLRARLDVEHGAGDLEWLDAAQLRDIAPVVSPHAFGALHCRSHGFVAVAEFLRALVAGAKYRGAIFSGSAATRIQLGRGSCVVSLENRSHVDVDGIVLCAGAWSAQVDPFGELREDVWPVKGQLVVLGWAGPRIDQVLWGDSCYIVPRADASLLVGATSEDAGFDERPTAQGVASLLNAAAALVPLTAASEFRSVRVGLRPATRGGQPIIRAAAADPRVFYATGHFRNGVLLTPLTASLVADHFLGQGA